MKYIYLKYCLVLIFVVILASCDKDKDKWKLPVDVNFKVDINRSPSKAGALVFTGGELVLSEFEFDGERMQGEDVYFYNSYENGLVVPFDPNVSNAELEFDIPQGTYTKIDIYFRAEGYGDKSIIIEGYYTDSLGTSNPVLFEFEEVEIYKAVAKDISGSNEIILQEGVPYTAKIILDPVYWFQSVSTKMLDDAELVDVNGVPTILINDWYNEAIFDLVMDRVDEGSMVVFE